MMLTERHSHKKFWLAIVILAVVAIAFLVATAWVSNELNRTQSSLLMARSEMIATQEQLANVEVELATTRTGLATVEVELATTQSELATVEVELNTTKDSLESLEATLFNLQVNYDRLTTGYGYVLRDPSYREMKDFLARDETSRRQYVESQYTCVDFSAGVKANAAKQGIRCAYVYIEYEEGGHAIVAFNTTDRGLVYIEPQFDWEVEPQIGRRYYQCVRPPTGYTMARPDYDDTIRRIVVIW